MEFEYCGGASEYPWGQVDSTCVRDNIIIKNKAVAKGKLQSSLVLSSLDKYIRLCGHSRS